MSIRNNRFKKNKNKKDLENFKVGENTNQIIVLTG